jgi:hypothetical protein
VNAVQRPLILLYIVDAGGGHRAAANALLAAAADRHPGFDLEIVSFQTVLEPVDWPRRISGVSLEDTYNEMVRRGFTFGLVPLLRALQWTIRRAHKPLVRLIGNDLNRRKPAVVVSLAPNFNAPLRDAVHQNCPGVPFVVMLTDYADFPPFFWMVPGIDRIVVGCDEAVVQARSIGIAEGHIARHSGMPLNPRFYPRASEEKGRAIRSELGIPEDAFTSLLLFGGKGTPEMAPLGEALLQAIPGGHVVAIGGSNPRLVRRLTEIGAREPRLHPFGFTDRVSDFMAMADVLVTKPGPGTVAEALHQRIPIVTIANGYTVPQERFNAQYLTAHGFGFVEGAWKDLASCVARLAQNPETRRAVMERQASLPPNSAVFEALDYLSTLLPAASIAAAIDRATAT